MTHDGQKRPRIKDIVRATCEIMGVFLDDLQGYSRLPTLLHARKIIAYVSRQHGYSYPQIGQVLRRDHTSVLYSVGVLLAQTPEEGADHVDLLKRIEERAAHLSAVARANLRTPRAPQTLPKKPTKAPLRIRSEYPNSGQFSDRWWEINDQRFCAAMRKAHPELDRGRAA